MYFKISESDPTNQVNDFFVRFSVQNLPESFSPQSFLASNLWV